MEYDQTNRIPINPFRLNIALRLLLMIFLAFALAFSWNNPEMFFTPILFGLFITGVIINLFHYIDRSNRDLSNFLNNIYHQDFSLTVPKHDMGESFDNLSSAYQLITQSFRRLNFQKQENQQLLESVVEHIDVAILCVADSGKIKLMNSAAKALLQSPHLHHIDSLRRIDPFIADCVTSLVDGERQLISAHIGSHPVTLSIASRRFLVMEEHWQLISLQNIRDELEQKEVDSWQKLIRVLSHEILNSATPILSLSSAIKQRISLGQSGQASLLELSEEDRNDLFRSLDSIESRSRSLVEFVDAYKGLTQIPQARIVQADMNKVILNIQQLLQPELQEANIELRVQLHRDKLSLRIDPQLVEQVLINLVKNSADALCTAFDPGKGKRTISIATSNASGAKVLVEVSDNGMGIPEDTIDHIFMPFYTTKESGTGIGLSISRQIMFMNRGMLSAESKEGVGSRFSLEFSG